MEGANIHTHKHLYINTFRMRKKSNGDQNIESMGSDKMECCCDGGKSE